MSEHVSSGLIESLHAACVEHLLSCLQDEAGIQTDTRRLDPAVFLDKIAWNVLVPFVLAVTSKLTSEVLKDRMADTKEKKSSAERVRDCTGAELTRLNMSPEELAELVQAEVKGLGISRKQASALVQRLLRKIEGKDS